MAAEAGSGWRRYLVEFGGAMALYSISVFVTVRLYNRYEPEGALALCVALIPMLPTLLALWALLRHFWRQDELERRIMSESVLVAAIVVSLVSFAAGWVLVILQPEHPAFHYVPLLLVMPAIGSGGGVAQIFVRRRYR